MAVGVLEQARHRLRILLLRHWALFFFLLSACLATLTSRDLRLSINTQLPLLVGLFLYVLLNTSPLVVIN